MSIKIQDNWRLLPVCIGLALFLLSNNLLAATAKKQYKQTIDVLSAVELVLTSKNSGVVVYTWNDRKVRIEAEIKVSARSHKEAQQYLELVEITSINTGERLTISSSQPEIKPTVRKKSFTDWFFGPRELTIFISYRLWVPVEIDLNIAASKGLIHIENLKGSIHAETTEKEVDLIKISGAVSVHTTDSKIRVQLLSLGEGDIEVTTTNGDIQIELPGDAGVTLQAHAYGGEINSDFVLQQRGPFTRHTKFGWINGGGVNVRLFTTNGKINIKSL